MHLSLYHTPVHSGQGYGRALRVPTARSLAFTSSFSALAVNKPRSSNTSSCASYAAKCGRTQTPARSMRSLCGLNLLCRHSLIFCPQIRVDQVGKSL